MTSIQQTISPVDNSVYVERELADQHQIDTALNKAAKAQALWKNTSLPKRQAICHKAIDAFVSKKTTLPMKSAGRWVVLFSMQQAKWQVLKSVHDLW